MAHKYAFEDKINTNQQSKNYWFNIIPKNYKNINFQFEKDINENLKNLEPIFIVGLPRSGSTVVEAILSSGKKKISNLGETNLINWSVITTPNKTS